MDVGHREGSEAAGQRMVRDGRVGLSWYEIVFISRWLTLKRLADLLPRGSVTPHRRDRRRRAGKFGPDKLDEHLNCLMQREHR